MIIQPAKVGYKAGPNRYRIGPASYRVGTTQERAFTSYDSVHSLINPAASIILTPRPTKDMNEPGRPSDKPVMALGSFTRCPAGANRMP